MCLSPFFEAILLDALTSLNDIFKLGSSGGGKTGPTASDRATTIRSFDTASERDWYELIRDIVAVANSGGGQINLAATVDESEIIRRLADYTDSEFTDVSVRSSDPPDDSVVAIIVRAALVPIGLSKAADCGASASAASIEDVFPAGSFYFRHGERSEPGTTADMRAFVERLLRRVRRRWLRRIRRVLSGPLSSAVGTTPKQRAAKRKKRDLANLQPVRIVTDPDAPALQPQDVDRLYPWRQKDLVRELNGRIGRRALNSYDIQAVRRQHRLDERPDFVFNLPGAGRRYSPAVADWIMDEFSRDPEFFRRARAADQELLRLRRQKPK